MVKVGARFVTGEAWKRARLRFDLSQKEAAALVGVDETTVQRWEGGQTKRVRRLYLEKLSESAPDYKRKLGGA